MSPVQRIAQALAKLDVVANVGALDYGKVRVSQGKGGHGKHGATSAPPPGQAAAEADEYRELLELVAEVGERRVAALRDGVSARLLAEDRDDRIVNGHAGRSAEWVAVLEGCSTSHVKRLRAAHGVKPSTGRPLRRIPVDPDIDALYGGTE